MWGYLVIRNFFFNSQLSLSTLTSHIFNTIYSCHFSDLFFRSLVFRRCFLLLPPLEDVSPHMLLKWFMNFWQFLDYIHVTNQWRQQQYNTHDDSWMMRREKGWENEIVQLFSNQKFTQSRDWSFMKEKKLQLKSLQSLIRAHNEKNSDQRKKSLSISHELPLNSLINFLIHP